MKALVLGGSGNAGKAIISHLLQQTDLEILIGGRSSAHNQQTLNELVQKTGIAETRIATIRVDAAKLDELRNAFKAVDFIIVASSTSAYAANILQAALIEKKDYLDISLPSPEIDELYQKMQPYIQDTGLCIIRDGGFHPGVPAALVRYSALHISTLQRAEIGALLKVNWNDLSFSEGTALEFMQEIKYFTPEYWNKGTWQKSFSKKKYFNFSAPFLQQSAIPMMLGEMRDLPKLFPSLEQCGFYMGGFDPFTDNVILPSIMLISNIFGKTFDRPLSRWMFNSMKKHAKAPFRAELLLLAEGMERGKPVSMQIRLGHQDAYALTAVPVVACVSQYLEQKHKTGIFYQAHFVEPGAFFEDMQRMGLELSINNEEVPVLG